MDLCGCQVVSERPEMTTWMIAMTTGRWNCQMIQIHREEGRDQEWNGSALCLAMRKT